MQLCQLFCIKFSCETIFKKRFLNIENNVFDLKAFLFLLTGGFLFLLLLLLLFLVVLLPNFHLSLLCF